MAGIENRIGQVAAAMERHANTPMPRRTVLLAGVAAALTAACTGGRDKKRDAGIIDTDKTPTTYDLERRLDGSFVDQHLPSKGPLVGLAFSYNPNRDEGSLVAEICLEGKGSYRVTAEEESPESGFLVDRHYRFDGGPAQGDKGVCVERFPVTELGRDDDPSQLDRDVEHVYIGVGDTELGTYENMRHYLVDSTEKGVQKITYLGTRTIDPATIKFR